MKIGALIVTTGLPSVSGVTALLSEVGTISAGQRMISAFQCAGASLVVPETKHVNGYPLLLDDRAMEFLLAQPDFAAAEAAVRQGALPLDSVRVDDSGILLRGPDMRYRQQLIQNHNRQLSRPIAEVT